MEAIGAHEPVVIVGAGQSWRFSVASELRDWVTMDRSPASAAGRGYTTGVRALSTYLLGEMTVDEYLRTEDFYRQKSIGLRLSSRVHRPRQAGSGGRRRNEAANAAASSSLRLARGLDGFRMRWPGAQCLLRQEACRH